MVKGKCVICGKTFYYEGRRVKTCSEECRAELQKKIEKEQKEKLQNTIKICECCGKEFHPSAYRQLYCTPKCGKELRREKEKENKAVKRIRKKKKGKSVLTDAKLAEIHKDGKTYAQYQIEQTIELYGRVNLW